MKEKETKAEREARWERMRTAPERMRELVAKNNAEWEKRKQQQAAPGA
jgi:hypothetical protein